MTETEKLLKHIEALEDSIQTDWIDLSTMFLTVDDRKTIRANAEGCIETLKSLLEQVSVMDD